MKYNEFHRLIKQKGWLSVRQTGSHVIYEKDGIRYPVPNHGSKEIPEPLRLKIAKEMGLSFRFFSRRYRLFIFTN